jgi:[FeFe] hydrogenase H-cluster maturation GTPase HydF
MAILVERDTIGIFGRMNSGKSSIMNLLTQQETSIVDSTAGTTADTKITLQEIHGIGPVKIFDTAGADEQNILGDKKRKKVFSDLKECDLALIIIDPSKKDFITELELLNKARDLDKQILIIYNLFQEKDFSNIKNIEETIPLLRFYKKITISAIDENNRQPLLNFILKNFESKNLKTPLLPFLKQNEYYILVIPMDEETPPGRLLRPQAITEEYITRNWAYPVCFRMDLGKARNKNIKIQEKEKKRFLDLVNGLAKKPKAIVTDSQAMDIMNNWCPSNIGLTTFSIIMINYISRGNLKDFVSGIKTLEKLKKQDKVLIVEACNHSRIGEDIGTVQIPNYLKNKIPEIIIEHNFGREFQENNKLQEYKLIIHCGACMISPQKLMARIRDLENLKIPFTNYGIILAYMQGEKALKKALKLWGI